MIRIRQIYDDHDAMSLATGLECTDPSLTVQSEKDDADINVIVERFGISGELPQNVRVPLAEDFDDVYDFQSAMNATIAARDSFMQMPANVRARFQNDPHQFVDFCTEVDDSGTLKNLDEMRKLGLAVEAVKQPVEPPKA